MTPPPADRDMRTGAPTDPEPAITAAQTDITLEPLPESFETQIRHLDASDLSRKLKQREQVRAQARAEKLKERSSPDGKRRRKRKAALAFSAGIVGMSTAAVPPQVEPMETAIEQSVNVRTLASTLKASDEMKRAMMEEEGVRYVVYRDVAGYPTVGIGHLVLPEDGLSVGDRITEEQALDFLEKDLAKAEAAVARLVGDMPVYQHEFDALVDLVYNVGEGNVSESQSPRLNEAIAMRDYQAIADELAYHHAGGREARGLVYRSERRTNIFLEAAYDDPREVRTAINRNV